MDGGGGAYAVLKTEHWAVESAAGLAQIGAVVDQAIKEYDAANKEDVR